MRFGVMRGPLEGLEIDRQKDMYRLFVANGSIRNMRG